MKILLFTVGMLALPVMPAGLLAQDSTNSPGKPLYSWQVLDGAARERVLNQLPPQVRIVPSVFPASDGYTMQNGKYLGTGISLRTLLGCIFNFSPCRIVAATPLPEENFDFIANQSDGRANTAALRREIESQFHLAARTETLDTNVLLLTVKSRDARGLKPSTSASRYSTINGDHGFYRADNAPLEFFARQLEYCLDIPVLDQTGMAGRFDIDIKWKQLDPKHLDRKDLEQVLLEQLGLELVPARKPIKMLIVEKAK